MNSAAVFFALVVVASASASITPVTPEQQQASSSAVAPITVGALPIDVYGRPQYRSFGVADAIAAAEQKVATTNELIQPAIYQGAVVPGVGVNYYPQYASPAVLNSAALAVHPGLLGGRLLSPSLAFSPAARGFALGGLVGLGAGLSARSLIAGGLAGPVGVGIHSALSTPALGLGLGAGAAALLG